MKNEIRHACHPSDVKKYDTQKLIENFQIKEVMRPGEITSVYSMYDRMMTIGIAPTDNSIKLPAMEDVTKASFFTQRRELGVINIGGNGTVNVDGEKFELAYKECLYIGKGSKSIVFESDSASSPAEFFINSSPAHKEYPTKKAELKDANKVELGSPENCNQRTIFQYIHEDGIQSCQLVMGFTELSSGSIWNTFPPHTHNRRIEVYFYFEVEPDHLVMHLMGEPHETRHIAMRNKQAVISPEWSIHAGAGTQAYSFIWGMAGENKEFVDMDAVDIGDLR